jgi:hypothetical protein
MWENDVMKGIWKEYDGECVDCMHLSQDGDGTLTSMKRRVP